MFAESWDLGNQFYFFQNFISFFSKFHFFKKIIFFWILCFPLNFINEKACLINWNHENDNLAAIYKFNKNKKILSNSVLFLTNFVFSINFLDSILMIKSIYK